MHFIKHLFLFIACLLVASVSAQKPTYMSVKKQKKDFKVLKEALLEVTGKPYLYTDSVTLNTLFDSVETQLNSPQTISDLFKMYSLLVAKVKCGHTMIIPSGRILKEFVFYNSTLPVDLTVIDDKIVLTENMKKTGKAKKGAHLIEMGGKKDMEILGYMRNYLSSDGENTTMKNHFLAEFFNLYYFILCGAGDSLQVKVVSEQNDTLTETWPFIMPSFKKLKAKANSSLFSANAKRAKKYGELKTNNKHHYISLILPTFHYDDEKKYRKFLDEQFKKINQSKAEYLVIDLRNNLGGIPQNYLMCYLTDKRSEVVSFEVTNTHLPHYKRRYKKFNEHYHRYKKTVRRTRRAIRRGKSSWGYKGLIIPKDEDLRCTKKVIVLTNGLTFSAGANLTANLKEKSKAVIIGEETGGSYQQGNTGQLQVTLPYSKFLLSVNPIYFNNCIHFSQEKNAGVTPDVVVHEKFGTKKKDDPYIIALEKYIDEQLGKK